ncbi:MAG: HAD-IA family hydrolase [Rhodocyclaceae bacterium]|nr:HAD-IA family hydrolase [Rhodocyclaceae bacterium]MBX3669810.1 HAD-IA family hydrolase [Rhodocyclaceae bacterium]
MSRAKNFDLIVFDWDGTLMDSAATIAVSLQAAYADAGLPVPARSDAQEVIGLGLFEGLARLAPGASREKLEEVAHHYRLHYLRGDQEIAMFDGVADLLQRLYDQGFLLGVATGKSRRGLDRSLLGHELGALFHATRTADDCHPKPHPAMLLELMDTFGVAPERTLMVGDTSFDLEMAANAGTRALGVTYGAHAREALERLPSLALLDSVPALAAWLSTHA